jgi:hypothetical protein
MVELSKRNAAKEGLGGKADTLEEGISLSEESIDSGRAGANDQHVRYCCWTFSTSQRIQPFGIKTNGQAVRPGNSKQK